MDKQHSVESVSKSHSGFDIYHASSNGANQNIFSSYQSSLISIEVFMGSFLSDIKNFFHVVAYNSITGESSITNSLLDQIFRKTF